MERPGIAPWRNPDLCTDGQWRMQRSGLPVLNIGDFFDRQIYFHLDLDVLDPAITPSNYLAPSGGLTVEQVEEMIHLIAEQYPIGACAIIAYEPELDPAGVTLNAGFRLMGQLASTRA